MKKRMAIVTILLLSGMLAGCFSANEAQQPSKPSTAPGIKDTSASSSDQAVAAEPKKENEAVPSGGQVPIQQEKTQSEAESVPQKEKAPTMTVDQVSSKYKQQLTGLRSYYAGQLQSLYGGAVADVKAQQDSKQAILAKYAKRARAIEEESQAKVNQVLAKMKQELLTHQLPTNKVNEYRSTYYAELDAAKNKAMAQVKTAVGM